MTQVGSTLMKQALISDIILDYVISPVEGEYTTPNTKKRIRSLTSTPTSSDKQQYKNCQTGFETIVTLELIVLFDH